MVAEWGVTCAPAAAAPIPADRGRILDAWGREETGYAIELILSELITHAIRYGSRSIQVRMPRESSAEQSLRGGPREQGSGLVGRLPSHGDDTGL
ncbi:hypothetical protein [Streptomyces sp. NPDC001508]|uniref:hypothetical protein n=1 Tax=Streptomyces sp. NPDC001508 TaxID=3154656 RepID=UPI003330C0B6